MRVERMIREAVLNAVSVERKTPLRERPKREPAARIQEKTFTKGFDTRGSLAPQANFVVGRVRFSGGGFSA